MHTDLLFNDGWRFHKGDIKNERGIDKGPIYSQSKTERKHIGPAAYCYPDRPDPYSPLEPSTALLSYEHWEYVQLPHDFIVDQDFDREQNNCHGYLKYDNAWYRKHFVLPEGSEGKRILLRFDGIATKSEIYLNGCILRHNFSAYNTIELDISDYVFFDRENVVAVYVNTTDEFEGWWYQGGGIYRNVWLTVTEPVAIELNGVYAPYKKLNDTDWQIDFETTVLNTDYFEAEISLKTSVIDADGVIAAEAEGKGCIALRDKATVYYSAVVNSPKLWDCDEPNLYSVKTVLYMNGEAIDENYTRIGFRTVEITVDKGLLLNGKKTFINGVCAHQDFGLTGIAVPDNIAKYKISLIKEMGANGYRTSHYQQTTAYLDALDEMGFLVMDEARWFDSTPEAIEQLESLIKRDRNRPSVIFWSTSNEEPTHATDNGKRLHKAIAAHIKKLDRTRYITAAQDKTPEKSTIYSECDLIGINYNLELYDIVHEMIPNKPVFASECCATGTTRDWNFDYNNAFRLRDKDRDANDWFKSREYTWKHLKARPYVFGAYQWVAVEHRGESTWPSICSKSGAFDIFLQRKGAFYQNKAHWTDEPMAHIVPHWNFKGLEGEDILVTVYTNCDELELFLNEKQLGRKTIEKYGHGEWSVPYEAGRLSVKGYEDGKMVCEDERCTTGKAVSLRLTKDNEFEANGSDIALFTCECLDEDGNVVPDASEFVTFSVDEPNKLIGTGSDTCDHIRISCNSRKMYMGKIRIAVKPQKDAEKLVLTAQSDNCGATRIKVIF